MSFKFCILAAGRGTRNSTIGGLHKALFPVSNRPVISIIIDKVPKTIPIVVALGHKAEQIESYLSKVHSDRTFEFVYVENYSGPGSGTGLSLLKCEESMQCPFIFTSADTIVDEDMKFSSIEENWVGISQVTNTESHEYCLVKSKKGLVNEFFYGRNKNAYAFTGIAGVLDYKQFWNGLRQGNIIRREHQVLDGLRALDDVGMFNMTWLDTGNVKAYNKTKSYYPNDLVVEKDDEVIYVDNGWVVKYFQNTEKAQLRIKRADELVGCAPEVFKVNDNMFCYRYQEGKRISDIYDDKRLRSFLFDYEDKFRQSNLEKDQDFLQDCDKMYREKTHKRIIPFVDTPLDNVEIINGVRVKPIAELVNDVDWDSLKKKAVASRFHGDMQPENVLATPGDGYLYIDWRESFGDSYKVGDAYYDLGKLFHALIISNSLIIKGGYNIDVGEKEATFSFVIKNNLYNLLEILKSFCFEKEYDYNHVQLTGILNYLNIASLYDKFDNGKYGKFLFLLGKYMLTKLLEKKDNEY